MSKTEIPESITMNRFQPNRPLYNDFGKALLYRTRPTRINYRVCDRRNQMIQLILYRYAQSPEYIDTPSISELHEYLFEDYPSISKKLMGETLLQALRYDPRKLKGKTKDNPKACMIYHFINREDLIYGLEWMICTWLRKFLNDEAAPGEPKIESSSGLLRELDILATCTEEEFLEVYLYPIRDGKWKSGEPNWKEQLRLHGEEPDIPVLHLKEKKLPPKPKWNGGSRSEAERDPF